MPGSSRLLYLLAPLFVGCGATTDSMNVTPKDAAASVETRIDASAVPTLDQEAAVALSSGRVETATFALG